MKETGISFMVRIRNEEKTLELMNYIFDEEYNHLDVDCTDNSIRKNFKLLEIAE